MKKQQATQSCSLTLSDPPLSPYNTCMSSMSLYHLHLITNKKPGGMVERGCRDTAMKQLTKVYTCRGMCSRLSTSCLTQCRQTANYKVLTCECSGPRRDYGVRQYNVNTHLATRHLSAPAFHVLPEISDMVLSPTPDCELSHFARDFISQKLFTSCRFEKTKNNGLPWL